MLNDYHSCEKIRIGSSDIAALIAVGCGEDDLKTAAIDYGEDGGYSAYVCDEKTAIPDYYAKVFECRAWLKIYDDAGLMFDSTNSYSGFNRFAIYRAGSFGTIIKMAKD